MTEAMRDAVRALFRVVWGFEIDNERVDGIIKLSDDTPFYTNAKAVIEALSPHLAAREAAAVASAVLAERAGCAEIADKQMRIYAERADEPENMGIPKERFLARAFTAQDIALSIRARSTQESGR